ncbi:MAG: hypothetical protein FWD56_00440 [Bacteroidales bacterium]|nr:hypothetical protein [Bacteroidales bacterium]
MKIKIDRELKIRLLKALKDGFIDTDRLPELLPFVNDPFAQMRENHGIDDTEQSEHERSDN